MTAVTEPEPTDPVPAPNRSRRWLFAALAGLAVLYLGLALWFAETKSVWSPDTGARLIQVQSILRHPPDWSIIYPAEDLDPHHQNSPLAFYEYRHAGKSYIFYSFLFALLSAPFFAAFGYFGLAILPMLGGLAAFLITYGLGRLLRFRYPLAPALIVGLATPLPLYSVVFWDHAILAAIGMGAVYLALLGVEKDCWRGWLAAGVLLGAGVWLHEIIVPYIPALLVMAWWLRKRHSAGRNAGLLLIGAMALILPLLLLNLRVYGSASGPHLANNKIGSAGGILDHLKKPDEWGLGLLYTLIGWGDANPAYTWQLKQWVSRPSPKMEAEIRASFWMGLPLLCWIPVALSGLWKRASWLVPAVLGLFAVGSAGWILQHKELVHGLFYASPLLALALIAPLSRPAVGQREKEALPRLLLQGLAVSTAVYAFITMLKPTLGGTEWGSRHLLSIVPALALLAWAALEELLASRRVTLGAVQWERGAVPVLGTAVLLLVASLAVTFQGARVAHSMHQSSGQLARAIESAPDDVIVTTVWWATTMAAPAYPAKKIVSAEDAQHPAPQLFARMRAKGVRTFTLLGWTADDLLLFALPEGYVPVRDTQRAAPMQLKTRRYFLAGEQPEAEPDLPPPPPGESP